MASKIFRSRYEMQRIENLIEHGAPIVDPTSKHWLRWDIDADDWSDTGSTADSETAATEAQAAQAAAELAQEKAEDAQDAAEDAQDAAEAAAASTAASTAAVLGAYPHDSVSSSAVASFSDGADGIPVRALTAQITPVQSGGGDPSPNNVRPISGWSAVRYVRSRDAGIRPKVGTWTGTTGSLVSDGKTFHRNFAATSTALNLIPTGAVPEVLQGSAVAGRYYCHLNYSGTKSVTGIKFEFSTPDGADYVYIDNGSYGTVKSTFTFRRVFVVSIEGGEFSAGDYFDLSDLVIAVEPDTASISLGQTVYGGELNVTTGVLRIRPYYGSYNGETLVGPWVSSQDVYTPGGTPTMGAQVVDMGGTETTVQLTPTEVKSLLGDNNIWCDTGDVSVDYRADTTLYIGGKVNAIMAAIAEL